MGSNIEPAASIWRYLRADCAAVEYSLVHGHAVGLPPHFHDEDQFTFVRVGQRRFVIGDQIVSVEAGRGLLIAAGVVHRSLPEKEGASALNVYMPAGTYALDRVWRLTARDSADRSDLSVRELAALIEECRMTFGSEPIGIALGSRARSREGFSRAFAQHFGLPPVAYGRATRLNQARALLRTGESIAAVAADSGFVDQSHLGRLFKKHFGTTPDRYRRGLSHPYQTEAQADR